MRKFFLISACSVLFAGFVVGVAVLHDHYVPDPVKGRTLGIDERTTFEKTVEENLQLKMMLEELLSQKQLYGGPNSFVRNHGQIFGGPNTVLNNPSQFLPKPPPKGGSAPAEDAACRSSNLQLGVVLDEKQPCVDIGKVVEGLAVGTYVFNKPEKVYLGVPFRIALTLKTKKTQDVTEFFAGLPGSTTEREAKWSQSLEASLRGDEMAVKPEGGQERTATKIGPVSWEWTITPQAGGKKTIVIEVAANILVGDKRNKVQIETLREPIEVTVSNLERVKAYVAGANSLVLAIPPTVAALAAIAGFVPPVRNAIVRLWRRLRRQETQGSGTA